MKTTPSRVTKRDEDEDERLYCAGWCSMNWLGAKLADDAFGAAMLKAGISEDTIMSWTKDPQVRNLNNGFVQQGYRALACQLQEAGSHPATHLHCSTLNMDKTRLERSIIGDTKTARYPWCCWIGSANSLWVDSLP